MTWHDAFVNYLSVLPGTTGITLAYVIRSDFAPDYSIYHDTFNKQLIAQAPLQGRIFLNDTGNVFQLLTSLTVSTSAEEWISASKPRSNGRTAFRALVDHYSGVGFQSRQLATAESLDKTLHYKNERAMPFAQFSIKLQQMFNLYREHDQELTNNSKLQHLFRKIQCSDLSHCVASLESEHNLHHLTFDKAINHITTILSRLQSSSRLASISSAGSRVNHTGRDRGRGRGGDRGRGRGRGRGQSNKRKWIAPDVWKNISEQDRATYLSNKKNDNASFVADVHSIAMISAITQAHLDKVDL